MRPRLKAASASGTWAGSAWRARAVGSGRDGNQHTNDRPGSSGSRTASGWPAISRGGDEPAQHGGGRVLRVAVEGAGQRQGIGAAAGCRDGHRQGRRGAEAPPTGSASAP